MKEKDLIDTFIKDNLSKQEEIYDENAWIHMRTLLEKEKDKPFLISENKETKKNQNKKIIGMISLSILTSISALSVWHFNAKEAEPKQIEKQESILDLTKEKGLKTEKAETLLKESKQIDFNEYVISTNKKELQKTAISSNGINTNLEATLEKESNYVLKEQDKNNVSSKAKVPSILVADPNSNQTDILNSTNKFINNEPIDTLQWVKAYLLKLAGKETLPIKEVKVKKVVLSREVYVEPTYKYTDINSPEKPIKDGWIGMYYTQQSLNKSWDSVAHGFNFQFMSGNLKNWNKVAIYGGFDWGMLFYGSSKRAQIAINTDRKDSGYTFLRSTAMDLMFKTHIEFNTPRFSPYISLTMGPRLYYTRQRTEAYMRFKEYESGSSSTVLFNASFMGGIGAGLRVPLYKRVSLDARMDYLIGTNTQVANLQQSSFNGLEYRLAKINFNPENLHFRIGLVFDLSEKEQTKTLVTEGYKKMEMYDSIIVEQKGDSSIIKIDCGCCDKLNKLENRMNLEINESDSTNLDSKKAKKVRLIDILNEMDMENNGGGSSGGGDKRSFPGTTTPSSKRH